MLSNKPSSSAGDAPENEGRGKERGKSVDKSLSGRVKRLTERFTRAVSGVFNREEIAPGPAVVDLSEVSDEPKRLSDSIESYVAAKDDLKAMPTKAEIFDALQADVALMRDVIFKPKTDEDLLAKYYYALLESFSHLPQLFSPSKDLEAYFKSCLGVLFGSEGSPVIDRPFERRILRKSYKEYEEEMKINIHLRGVLMVMQSFNNALFDYVERHYRTAKEDHLYPYTGFEEAGDKLESAELHSVVNEYLSDSENARRPHIATLFEKEEMSDVAANIRSLLPEGMTQLHLLDTMSFLDGAITSRVGSPQSLPARTTPVLSVFSEFSKGKLDLRFFDAQNIMVLPETKEGKIDPLRANLKDIVFWRSIPTQDYYMAAKDEEYQKINNEDEVSSVVEEHHLVGLIMRLLEAFVLCEGKSSMNIAQLFSSLFPNIDPSIFLIQNRGQKAPMDARLLYLSAAAHSAIVDEEFAKFFVQFVSCVRKHTEKEWGTKMPGKSFTLFQGFCKKAKFMLNSLESDHPEVYESYRAAYQQNEDSWMLLDAKCSDMYVEDQLGLERLTRRMSGWRQTLRDLYNMYFWKVIDDLGVGRGDILETTDYEGPDYFCDAYSASARSYKRRQIIYFGFDAHFGLRSASIPSRKDFT